MNIPEHAKCINCGECCGPILATKREIAEIQQYVKKTISGKERKRLKRQVGNSLTCQFRDDEKKRCAIYPVRPEICRLFGVVAGMMDGGCPQGNSALLDGAELIDMSIKRTLLPDML